jgi:hypothetical protein
MVAIICPNRNIRVKEYSWPEGKFLTAGSNPLTKTEEAGGPQPFRC